MDGKELFVQKKPTPLQKESEIQKRDTPLPKKVKSRQIWASSRKKRRGGVVGGLPESLEKEGSPGEGARVWVPGLEAGRPTKRMQ